MKIDKNRLRHMLRDGENNRMDMKKERKKQKISTRKREKSRQI